MDLIVLLSSYPAPTTAPAPTPMQLHMMRMRGLGGNLKDEGKTKVSLWRTGGDKVWEIDVGGRVTGMAWMEDGGFTGPNSDCMGAERFAGLHLSLLVINSSKKTTETLSVHSGEVARSVPLELDVPDLQDGQWLDMEYRDSGLRWEKPLVSVSLFILQFHKRLNVLVEWIRPNDYRLFTSGHPGRTSKARQVSLSFITYV